MMKEISRTGMKVTPSWAVTFISMLLLVVILPVMAPSSIGHEDGAKVEGTSSIPEVLSTPTPGVKTIYKDKTVNITTLRVKSGDIYEFINCTLNFQNAGSQLVVEKGGMVNITGSKAAPKFNSNITSKSRLGYVIKALNGSSLNIERTNISAPTSSLTYPAMMMLHEGRINASWISDLSNHVRILQSGVILTNTIVYGNGAGASLVIDTNHTWSQDPSVIRNVELRGRFTTALRVLNNSVWRPYDLQTSNIYYAGSGTVELTFNWTVVGYVSPYIKVPHFLDSRSSQAVLSFQYNDGTWKSFSGFPKSNTVFSEWVNADDSRISLTGTAYNTPMRLRFTAPDNGHGCAYIGMPLIGGQGRTETALTTLITEAKMGAWAKNIVTTPSLLIDQVKVFNGTSYLLYSSSSGSVNMTNVDIGVSTVKHSCPTLAMISNSGISWVGGKLLGTAQTRTGLRVLSSGLGNDWTLNTFRNLTINDTAVKFDHGVDITGGWTELKGIHIDDTHYGVRSSSGLLKVDGLDSESEEYGLHITLPSSYPLTAPLNLFKVTVKRGAPKNAGIYLKGTSLSYIVGINIQDCNLQSLSSDRYVRSDSMGVITLDITSSVTPTFKLMRGEIQDGTGHGLAITNWPSNGFVVLESITIKSAPLDGLYLRNAQKVSANGLNIRSCGGWGIYTQPYSTLNLTSGSTNTIDLNAIGGIFLADHGTINMKNTDVLSNGGSGMVIDTDCRGTIDGCRFPSNDMNGLDVKARSAVTILQSEFSSSKAGHGIHAVNAALTIQGTSTAQQSKAESNALNGLNMVGGSLTVTFLKCASNKGTGAVLESLASLSMTSYEGSQNVGEGLHVHVTSDGTVPLSGNYFNLTTMVLRSNQGSGILLSTGESVTRRVPVGLKAIKVDSNINGDLIADPKYDVLWTMSNYDEVGSETFQGRVLADLDINVISGSSPKLRNENLSLLGTNNVIDVNAIATLNLKNCHIRPYRTTDRFTVLSGTGSKVIVKGGYLGYLDQFKAVGSSRIELDRVLVSGGTEALVLDRSQVEILGSSLESIDGTALYLKDGKGNITNSIFKNNQKGMEVVGVSQNLKVIGTHFIDNKWGMYLFSNKTKNVEIRDCTFSGNRPAPIYLENAKATLIDSTVSPYDIQVSGIDGEAIIKFTLTAEVLNEERGNVPFDIIVVRGDPAITTIVKGIPSLFSREFESYRVRDPLIPFQTGVDSSLVTTFVQVTYIDRQDPPNNHYSSEDMLIELTMRTHLSFEGFQTPIKTASFDDNVLAYEDSGLIGGSIDIGRWFSDIGKDNGNLSFSVTGQVPQISPYLMGDKLFVTLQKDWNGEGSILLKATDPHGKSLLASVTVTVIPVNDPPMVSNVKITSSMGSPAPRTGDVLIASWDWYDIDPDDPQPSYQIIQWYRDGTHITEYDNQRAIPNVVSGQVWNFTITPADWHGLNYGDLGSPVWSAPVRVGNAPPTLGSITFTSRTPRTDQDLLVVPGTWDDPDSGTVTFHYLWEKRSGSEFVSIGAPDSPILESRFTKKGDEIKVNAWTFDGEDRSDVVTDSVIVRNSPPTIRSARLMPSVVDESTERIHITDLVWTDPDGDVVRPTYYWSLSGLPISVTDTPDLNKSQANWRYPDHQNISVEIVPEDSDNEQGPSYVLSVRLTPIDTDKDGIPDISDNDDDNDGWFDEKELVLGSDPLNPFSNPLDTDRDGLPDGDALNTYIWMDTDDDNDGIPDTSDPYTKNPALPGDMDLDGLGDDRDPDIDGDGVPNKKDSYPYDPFRSKLPEDPFPWLQVIILIMVLVIIAGAAALGYLIYNGTIKLPSSAPPQIDTAEVEFEEDSLRTPKGKADKDLEDLEDLESMSVCSACGELISMEASTCPNCGVQFEEEPMDLEEFDEDEE
ncbi:MAG: right-handed parallel beta-helix repeat-containing protein [Candidatus Thermoplasmatota archaeon]|jgi:hypothetical protein|nr:right-handed parallel beta-helix repeat-containing protein [Candidatus Thermoplasmatota archaeon]